MSNDSVHDLPCPLHNPKGQTVGRIEHEGERITLRKHVRPDAHRLSRPPGFCIATGHLDLLRGFSQRYGVPAFVELNADGHQWVSTLGDFAAGIPVHRGGYEPQRLLPLAKWEHRGPNGHQLGLFE